MKKIIFIAFSFFTSIGLLLAQDQKQKAPSPVQVTKEELLSFEDIKPILAIAFPGGDYKNYAVMSFNFAGSTTENTAPISFEANTVCGKFTEKQRSLIEKYGKPGMVFTVEQIVLREYGKPGTPYNPAEQAVISVPNVSFSIKE